MSMIPHKGKTPQVGTEVFVAEGAQVIGDVVLEDGASVWFNAVIRGDLERITIGRHSNVQDNCVIHADHGIPATLGENVTMGHGSIVHGATVGNNVLIGINSTILNRARVGDGCIIGANAVVAEGRIIPPGSLVLGVPGKVARQLEVGEIDAEIGDRARRYYEFAQSYLRERGQ